MTNSTLSEIYQMRPVIDVDRLEIELEKIHGRPFALRDTIMNPPGNDCYIKFSCSDYPMPEEEAEYYGEEYVQDYNFTCEYLKSLEFPYETFLVDITW